MPGKTTSTGWKSCWPTCAVPELRERKRGYFSLRSAAFLHFHEDSGDFYVDVKLDGAFQRVRVSTRTEQLDFLDRVRAALN
jgi:hypothetical protein